MNLKATLSGLISATNLTLSGLYIINPGLNLLPVAVHGLFAIWFARITQRYMAKEKGKN